MARRVGNDEGERKALDDIAKRGWHCLSVPEDGGEPPWSFTIGLFETWKHPELIVFGLKQEAAQRILNIIVSGLAEGKTFDLALPTDELIETLSCLFVEVPKRHYRTHVEFARWYYEGDGFPLYQIVWPNREGLFPWNIKARASFRRWQPILVHGSRA
jgi:hypothetical protein